MSRQSFHHTCFPPITSVAAQCSLQMLWAPKMSQIEFRPKTNAESQRQATPKALDNKRQIHPFWKLTTCSMQPRPSHTYCWKVLSLVLFLCKYDGALQSTMEIDRVIFMASAAQADFMHNFFGERLRPKKLGDHQDQDLEEQKTLESGMVLFTVPIL